MANSMRINNTDYSLVQDMQSRTVAVLVKYLLIIYVHVY